jgi:hypothetical protein
MFISNLSQGHLFIDFKQLIFLKFEQLIFTLFTLKRTLTNFMPPTNHVGSPFSIVQLLAPPPDVVLAPPEVVFADFATGALSSGPESESSEEELSRLAFLVSLGILSLTV